MHPGWPQCRAAERQSGLQQSNQFQSEAFAGVQAGNASDQSHAQAAERQSGLQPFTVGRLQSLGSLPEPPSGSFIHRGGTGDTEASDAAEQPACRQRPPHQPYWSADCHGMSQAAHVNPPPPGIEGSWLAPYRHDALQEPPFLPSPAPDNFKAATREVPTGGHLPFPHGHKTRASGHAHAPERRFSMHPGAVQTDSVASAPLSVRNSLQTPNASAVSDARRKASLEGPLCQAARGAAPDAFASPDFQDSNVAGAIDSWRSPGEPSIEAVASERGSRIGSGKAPTRSKMAKEQLRRDTDRSYSADLMPPGVRLGQILRPMSLLGEHSESARVTHVQVCL